MAADKNPIDYGRLIRVSAFDKFELPSKKRRDHFKKENTVLDDREEQLINTSLRQLNNKFAALHENFNQFKIEVKDTLDSVLKKTDSLYKQGQLLRSDIKSRQDQQNSVLNELKGRLKAIQDYNTKYLDPATAKEGSENTSLESRELSKTNIDQKVSSIISEQKLSYETDEDIRKINMEIISALRANTSSSTDIQLENEKMMEEVMSYISDEIAAEDSYASLLVQDEELSQIGQEDIADQPVEREYEALEELLADNNDSENQSKHPTEESYAEPLVKDEELSQINSFDGWENSDTNILEPKLFKSEIPDSTEYELEDSRELATPEKSKFDYPDYSSELENLLSHWQSHAGNEDRTGSSGSTETDEFINGIETIEDSIDSEDALLLADIEQSSAEANEISLSSVLSTDFEDISDLGLLGSKHRELETAASGASDLTGEDLDLEANKASETSWLNKVRREKKLKRYEDLNVLNTTLDNLSQELNEEDEVNSQMIEADELIASRIDEEIDLLAQENRSIYNELGPSDEEEIVSSAIIEIPDNPFIPLGMEAEEADFDYRLPDLSEKTAQTPSEEELENSNLVFSSNAEPSQNSTIIDFAEAADESTENEDLDSALRDAAKSSELNIMNTSNTIEVNDHKAEEIIAIEKSKDGELEKLAASDILNDFNIGINVEEIMELGFPEEQLSQSIRNNELESEDIISVGKIPLNDDPSAESINIDIRPELSIMTSHKNTDEADIAKHEDIEAIISSFDEIEK